MSSPPRLVLLAPGAGAPSTSTWMQRWKDRLESLGTVMPLDYPYMLAGRKYPDKLPELIAAHRRALEAARVTHPGRCIVLAGKSMGGRVGCHLSLEADVDALVCFGYPLKGASAKAPLRDQVLVGLRTPVLFVQGTLDALCPLDLLATTRERMTARSELHVVEGGDHSLLVKKTALRASGETQDTVDAGILAAITAFVSSVANAASSATR